jgi:predicted RNA-binding protein Jag
MRYEAKTERDAVEAAAKALNRTPESIKYRVVRDEKSFWGGRVVEIEIEGEPTEPPEFLRERGERPEGREDIPIPSPEPRPTRALWRDSTAEESAPAGQGSDDDEETWDARPARPARTARETRQNPAPESGGATGSDARLPGATGDARLPGATGSDARLPGATGDARLPGATDADAVAAVESTLTELLSAAGLLVEIRRRDSSGDELLFELFGDDVEPLLANKGEGLTGLEVLVGRIASKRLGAPVHARLDAEGFRAHRKEALEELARQSADEARRSRRPQLLPPLAPWERRLVHIALSEEPDVETESEGDGFMKRVEVRLKR